uniref:Endoplasmic reticulum membrane protein YGL010W n=1 Tax=Caligus clemensi TaxID=344056 RepID=C1C0L5_CALCM|nr:endoplasmic reticulum membrane protein YGL010W [Caligus clemensi]
MKLRDYFNLEKNLVFYGSYHSNPVNIGIHLLCIWNILWSFMYLLQFTGPISNLLPTDVIVENYAFYIFSLYIVIFLITDLIAGLIGSLLIVGIYFLTLSSVQGGALIAGFNGWKLSLGVHLSAWILQFIGHGVFEKRAPALLDNVFQAFITAPLFVLLEVMFFFGYKKDLYQSCLPKIKENVKKFHRKKRS